MRRTLAVSCLSISLALAALLAPSEAQACSCMQPPPPVEAARDVDLVFHAKLVSVAAGPAQGGLHGMPSKIFTFEVVRGFKGQLDAQVNVHTADNSAACGRSYGDPGSEWLIYGRIDDQGRTYDNLCSRTRPIDQAADDIAALDGATGTLDQPNDAPADPGPADPEPEPLLPEPVEPEPATPSKKGCSIPDTEGGANLAGLLVLGLGAATARRRRRRRGDGR